MHDTMPLMIKYPCTNKAHCVAVPIIIIVFRSPTAGVEVGIGLGDWTTGSDGVGLGDWITGSDGVRLGDWTAGSDGVRLCGNYCFGNKK